MLDLLHVVYREQWFSTTAFLTINVYTSKSEKDGLSSVKKNSLGLWDETSLHSSITVLTGQEHWSRGPAGVGYYISAAH